MNKKPPLQLSAFVGSVTSPPSPSMCFPSAKNEKQRDHHSGLCGCQKAPKSHCISATGVLILVLLYTAMGSIIFVTLEGELEEISSLETAVAASKPYPRTELANAEIRSSVNLLNPYEEMGKKEQLRYLYEYHLIDSDRIKEGRIQSNATVDRLWAITEDLNILYKENWTRLAAQEVQHFQDTLLRAVRQSKIHQPGIQISLPTHKWSYASAFLYSLTLITTIGYGGISPRTQWGRIAALVYALFGIPIVLLYLSAMGEGLSAAMRCLFRKARGSTRSGGGGGVGGGGNGNNNGNASNNSSSSNNKTPPSDVNSKSSTAGGGGGVGSISGKHFNHHQHQHQHQHQHHHHHHHQSSVKLHHHHYSSLAPAYQLANSPSVPISICIMVLISYVSLGAILFHKIQNWSVLEALYFCFTSLGTIGFGDLTPTGTLSLYLASGYILIGMAVVAMCFSLIQTEIILWLRRFSIQDHVFAPTEDVALVSVSAAAAAAASVTPKS